MTVDLDISNSDYEGIDEDISEDIPNKSEADTLDNQLTDSDTKRRRADPNGLTYNDGPPQSPVKESTRHPPTFNDLEGSVREIENTLQEYRQAYSNSVEQINREIDVARTERQQIQNQQQENQEQLNNIIAEVRVNSRNIERIENNQKKIVDNQSSMNEEISDLTNRLTDDLFMPLAKGLGAFSAIATIVFLIQGSIASIPFLILTVLFLTGVQISGA